MQWSVWRCLKKLWTQDISHYQTGAEVSGQLGISAEVSHGQFGTGTDYRTVLTSSKHFLLVPTKGRKKV